MRVHAADRGAWHGGIHGAHSPFVAEPSPAPEAPATPPPGEEARSAPRSGPVPLSVRLAFGAPSFAGAAMAIPIGIHLTIFYSDVVLVPLGFIALTKAISRALDALTDPLMGWITDRTRSRFGRRRPWIALGAPTCALAFWALFTPPESLGRDAAIVWLLTTYVLYYVFHTVYLIPHYGLGPEITQDYHERSRLFGVSEGFTVAGTLAAAVLPGLLKDQAGLGDRGAMAAFAVLFGLLLTALYWNLVWRVKERPEFSARPPNPLVPGMRRVMRNRVFRILLAVYLVGSTTGAIPGMMIPYFTKYVLQPENPDQWMMIYLASYFGAGFLFLPFWVWFAKRYGKKAAYLVTFLPGMLASFALFFLGPGDLWTAEVILVFAGSVFGARLFLAPALQADVIDYDELHTGQRREAQYGALWAFITKFTVILSMSVPLAILASAGYQPNQPQSDEVVLAIRAILGLAPATSALIAFVIAWRYPISEAVHAEIWTGIEAHRRGESAVDPITGETVAPLERRGVDEATGWFLDHFSPRELRRALRDGPASLTPRLAGFVAVGVLAFVVCVVETLATFGDGSRDPGIVATLWVLAGGLSLGVAAFHGVRLRAASRLRREPLDPERVLAHLDDVEASGGPA